DRSADTGRMPGVQPAVRLTNRRRERRAPYSLARRVGAGTDQLPLPAGGGVAVLRCRPRLDGGRKPDTRVPATYRRARAGVQHRTERPRERARLRDPGSVLRLPVPAPRQGLALGLQPVARLVRRPGARAHAPGFGADVSSPAPSGPLPNPSAR